MGADDRVALIITGDGLKTLDAVRDVPGVRAAEGSVSGYALLTDTHGAAVTTNGGAPTNGYSMPADRRLRGDVEEQRAVPAALVVAVRVAQALEGRRERALGERDDLAARQHHELARRRGLARPHGGRGSEERLGAGARRARRPARQAPRLPRGRRGDLTSRDGPGE